MKYILMKLTYITCMFIGFFMQGQTIEYSQKLTAFEASPGFPYGIPNPKAPEQIRDFDDLIGTCDCKSLQYRPGVANDTLPLLWKWKYILNGNAVQDEGWFGNDDTFQSSFTSIRILDPATKKWTVPFFIPQLRGDPQIWKGGRENDVIVLRKEQKSNSGDDIQSILTFSNISDDGFNWEGKIVNHTKNTSRVFWRIWCKKRRD
ncbi:MAG: hypothetical protein KDD31_09555 [Muricauda sp.]|nr:hypothetical protein [Allomuricauda sp.]